MREFVLALRAIWASWQDSSRLDFRGEFYQHTLMTPMFSPPPNPWGPPPVLLAAVGPRMTTVAAEVADGMLVHGFTTERYLREVTLPLIQDGLHASGRRRGRFSICYPGLVAAGDTDRDLETAVTAVREQLAFYGATPAYRPVLDLHGWGDLHTDLHQLSVRGRPISIVTASRMIVSAQLTKVRTFCPVRFRWCEVTTIGVVVIGSSVCRGVRAGTPTGQWSARPAPKRAGRGRYGQLSRRGRHSASSSGASRNSPM